MSACKPVAETSRAFARLPVWGALVDSKVPFLFLGFGLGRRADGTSTALSGALRGIVGGRHPLPPCRSRPPRAVRIYTQGRFFHAKKRDPPPYSEIFEGGRS